MRNGYATRTILRIKSLLIIALTMLMVNNVTAQSPSIMPGTASPSGGAAFSNYQPLGSFFGFQQCQMQYSRLSTPSDFGTAVNPLPAAGTAIIISDVAFFLKAINGIIADDLPVVIFMKETNSAPGLATATYSVTSTYTQVFSGLIKISSLPPPPAWQNITLDIPFFFANAANSNLEIIVQTNFGFSGGDFMLGGSRDFSRTATTVNQCQTWARDNTPPTATTNGALSINRPDVQISYVNATPCVGAPHAFNIATNTNAVCAGKGYTLSITGLYPPYLSGFTFQWLSSPTGLGGSFVPIVGATGPTYTGTLFANTWFQCVVSCGGSPTTSTNTIAITLNPVTNCYCIPTVGSNVDTDIGRIIFNLGVNPGVLGSATSNPLANGTYTDYTGIGILSTVIQGAPVNFRMDQITSGATFWGAWVNVFIDLNIDGIFDPTERVFSDGSTDGNPSTTSLNGQSPVVTGIAGLITVPYTSNIGITRMRVILRETDFSSGSPTNQPCDNFTFGEVEDYLIRIDTSAIHCNLTNPGTISVLPSVVCVSSNYTLTTSGIVTLGSGLSFQWQSSPSGLPLTFTNIVGATSVSYTTFAASSIPIYYRCIVTCSVGGSLITPVMQITPSNTCYCTPVHGTNCTGNFISNVSFSTLSNVTGCTSGTGLAYTQYPAAGATTTTVVQNSTYNLSVETTSTPTSNTIVSVWIDYNRNGIFEVSEWQQVALSNPTGITATIPITIQTQPFGTGLTGMRIRARAAGNQNFAPDACTQFFSGETEDYFITIDPFIPPFCNAGGFTPPFTTTASQASVCAGTVVNFGISGSTNYGGLSYQWQTSPAVGGPFTPIGPLVVNLSCNTTNASTTVTTASTATIVVGRVVNGVGIPALSTVLSITNGTTFVISQPATATATNTLTFSGPRNYSESVTVGQYYSCVITCALGGASFTSTPIQLTVSPATWLGFNNDWNNSTNWCGGVPTLVTDAQVSKTIAQATPYFRDATYQPPVAAYKDTVRAKNLFISSLDSLTILNDDSLAVNIASDINNSGKIAMRSTTADTVTIGTGTVISTGVNQIFRGNYPEHVYQIIYLASELNFYGIQPNDVIDSLLFQIYSRTSTNPYDSLQISYLQVDAATDQFISGDPITGPGSFTPIFGGAAGVNLSTAAPAGGVWTSTGPTSGWLRLPTPNFIWDGISNVVLMIRYSTRVSSPYISPLAADNMYLSSTSPRKQALFLSGGIVAGVSCTVTLGSTTVTTLSTANVIPGDKLVAGSIGANLPAGSTVVSITNATQFVISAPALGNATGTISFYKPQDGWNLTTSSPFLQPGIAFATPSINRPNVTLRFHRQQKKILANITGNINNNAGAKMWLSHSTVNIGGALNNSNTASLYVDSCNLTVTGNTVNQGLIDFTYTPISYNRKSIAVYNGSSWSSSATGIYNAGNSGVTFNGATWTNDGVYSANTSTATVNSGTWTNNLTYNANNSNTTVSNSNTAFTNNGTFNQTIDTINFNGLSWINNGTMNAGTSRIIFGTTAGQFIGGTANSNFNDLIIAKTTAADTVSLRRNINVANNISLTSGQLRMRGKSITVTNTATTAMSRTGGFLISEDSLSKVFWTINNVAGLHAVPFGDDHVAAPDYIPFNFTLTNGASASVGDISIATYKAASNIPSPPSVTNLNAGFSFKRGATGWTACGPGPCSVNVTLGGAPPFPAISAANVGNYVSGPGIPAGATISAFITPTLFTLSIPAGSISAFAGATVLTFTQGVPLGSNDSAYTADRFWILSKSIANTVPAPTTDLGFNFTWSERPCPIGASTCMASGAVNPPRPQPWYLYNSPLGHWISLTAPVTFPAFTMNVSGVNNAAVTGFNWAYGNSNPWAISTLKQPLPVELLSFDANLKGDDVYLNWKTASEEDNDFYTIERTIDNKEVIEVARVHSAGNSVDLRTYDTWDFNPVQGAINYYRLRQTDKNGESEVISDYVPVRIGMKSVFNIVFVRSEESTDVFYDYDSDQPLSYTLMDPSGRIVASGIDNTAHEGQNVLRINSATLAHGFYIIQLRNNDRVVTQKFNY